MKNEELNKKRGLRLKECRTNAHLTQHDLSDSSNFSKQHISYIECGKRSMSYEAAVIFSKILGVNKEYLLCESDYKNKAEQQKDSIEWQLDTLSFLDQLLSQLGYYIEECAEYQNLQTDEIVIIDDSHSFPENDPDTGPIVRDIGEDIVYETTDGIISVNRDEFEELARPKYKRISESYILHVFTSAKEEHIRISKEQRDTFISEIIDYIDFRISRFFKKSR